MSREYIITEHPDFPYEEPKPQELIRCKECKYYRTDSAVRHITCVYHISHVEMNDFCSYGCREERSE